jgi:apolipoprotein D and lipocalin family protein
MQKKYSLMFMLVFLLSGCTGIPEGLSPVKGFDAQKYLGKWYEIARLDHRFERNMTNVTAVYTQTDEDHITVLNRGYDEAKKKWKQITGKARLIKDENTGSLKVSFFGPFYSGYHIIALDKQHYRYAMVTGPKRSYLWILSRTRTMDRKILQDLILRADDFGFETDKLIFVRQDP